MATQVDIGTLIIRTLGTVGGRPRIAGTRISVQNIAIWHNSGLVPEEIIGKYDHLSLAQVHAAISYYYANKQEIDGAIEAEEKLAQELAKQYPRGA